MDDGIRLGLREESEASKHRGFCIGLAAVLGIFAFLSWHKGRHLYPYYAAGAALSALIGAARPSLIGPVYRPWMKAAGFLARINTYILTAVIYYGVFTPYAYFLRRTGRDPLDRGAAMDGSYWLAREPSADARAYGRQF